jgi:hypothetical protein
VLLLPIIQGLWLGLTVWALAWLVLPVVLVAYDKYRAALAVMIWWVVMFAVMAFYAFDYSAKAGIAHDSALGSSFGFAMAVIACLASISMVALITVFRSRSVLRSSLRDISPGSEPQ